MYRFKIEGVVLFDERTSSTKLVCEVKERGPDGTARKLFEQDVQAHAAVDNPCDTTVTSAGALLELMIHRLDMRLRAIHNDTHHAGKSDEPASGDEWKHPA